MASTGYPNDSTPGRSAIGHGTVVGVHKMGTTADNTMYNVEQHDHHPGEPAIVHHTGKAMSNA
jgi:hypothetical protein